jgi:hypothetical protein
MRTLLLLLLALVAIGLITPNPIMAERHTGAYEVDFPIVNDADAQVKCKAVLNEVIAKYPTDRVTWLGAWDNYPEREMSKCWYLLESYKD